MERVRTWMVYVPAEERTLATAPFWAPAPPRMRTMGLGEDIV